MNKKLLTLALSLGIVGALGTAAMAQEFEAEDVGYSSFKNNANDYSKRYDNDVTKSYDNDVTTTTTTTTNDNDTITKTWEDNDKLNVDVDLDFSQDNDVTKSWSDSSQDNDTKTITKTVTKTDSHDVTMDGLLNANDKSRIEMDNFANDNSTVFDGDIDLGKLGHGGHGGGDYYLNTGVADASIFGEGNAMFDDVGIGINGDVKSDATLNNNQTTLLNSFGTLP